METNNVDNDLFNPKLQIESSDKKSQIEKCLSGFCLTNGQIEKLCTLLRDELNCALEINPARESAFPLINTFVSTFPSGNEIGDFLALDIGGTNLRVVHLKLKSQINGQIERTVDAETYDVPLVVRRSSGKFFFGYLADCVKHFYIVRKLGLICAPNASIPLGLTFSFNYKQIALDRGEIVQMGPSTKVTDVVGQDPVKMLQDAINLLKIRVKVVALANDATAALIAAKQLDAEASVSLILGSGTNIAYVEEVKNFTKITNPFEVFGKADKFVVNTEFALFGDGGQMDFLLTKYDRELNRNSLIPNNYTYAKVTSGSFLGELLRLTLVDMSQNGLIFNGNLTPKLNNQNSIQSSDISSIESQIDDNSTKEVIKLMTRLGYLENQISQDDCAIVSFISRLISIRSAQLIASAISIFVQHLNLPVVKIGYDGSLIMGHPKLSQLIEAHVNSLLSPTQKCTLFPAEQGSSLGAAILTASQQTK